VGHPAQRGRAAFAILIAAGALAWGCSSGSHPTPLAHPAAPAATITVAPTKGAPTSSTVARLPGLQYGDSGPAILALEQRLAALRYDVGTPDGHFGPADQFAVIAFEKVHGMDRTGRATDDVLAAMAAASDPAPLVPAGGAMRVEVDVPHQVLFLYIGGTLNRILPVSTGSGLHYCEKGDCGTAVTPSGSYRVFLKRLGLDVSPLGQLYNPLYFNGGIAIHGEPAVPNYPASHGCVRIPMNSSLWFFNTVPYGTPVYVIGGANSPLPVNASAPPAATPASTSTTVSKTTTTTTARATTSTSAPHPTTTTT
jgi:peptidoglycan hydrolase-like protein with peptidoglycan-binding domain